MITNRKLSLSFSFRQAQFIKNHATQTSTAVKRRMPGCCCTSKSWKPNGPPQPSTPAHVYAKQERGPSGGLQPSRVPACCLAKAWPKLHTGSRSRELPSSCLAAVQLRRTCYKSDLRMPCGLASSGSFQKSGAPNIDPQAVGL